jgi:cytochrome bd ubiquinol oxidase subunit I
MATFSDHVMLSRLQFAFTTMFHITWPLLSIGLSIFLVVTESLWLLTKDPAYYHHTRFWSKLFILNFVVGVASGLPLEFQFGTNWSRFSTATHGFFGNILGFEGTMAFMLEAAFLGIMIFGWRQVSPRVHLFATCMVALGASLSAFWILVANSWMQTPAGGTWVGGRYVMEHYWQGIFSPDLPWGFGHMWVACLETTLFVVGGISAWYILTNRHIDFFLKSFKIAFLAAILIAPLQYWLGDGSGRRSWPSLWITTFPALLAVLTLLWLLNTLRTGKIETASYLLAVLFFSCALVSLAGSLYPLILPPAVTIEAAASSPLVLEIMLLVMIPLLPVMLIYNA